MFIKGLELTSKNESTPLSIVNGVVDVSDTVITGSYLFLFYSLYCFVCLGFDFIFIFLFFIACTIYLLVRCFLLISLFTI